MNLVDIFPGITEELLKAEEKFPGWPKDVIHGVAIIQEECGELVKACLDFYYGRAGKEKVLKEANQTGAMIVRFLLHYEDYKKGIAEKGEKG